MCFLRYLRPLHKNSIWSHCGGGGVLLSTGKLIYKSSQIIILIFSWNKMKSAAVTFWKEFFSKKCSKSHCNVFHKNYFFFPSFFLSFLLSFFLSFNFLFVTLANLEIQTQVKKCVVLLDFINIIKSTIFTILKLL